MMSRLEEMSKNVIGMTDDEGDFIDVVKMDIEVHAWFYQQAERVKELEEENAGLHDILEQVEYQEKDKLLAENKRYREALEFYADEENYELDISYNPAQAIDCMILDDSGHQARKALEGED